jgi:hypothetical protein
MEGDGRAPCAAATTTRTGPDDLGRMERLEATAWRRDFPGRDLGVFHLARFRGRLCLFHRGGLAVSEPAAWAALQAIAGRLDAALVVDRRERITAVANDRRRTALALTVAAGLFTRAAVAGEAGGSDPVRPARPAVVAIAAADATPGALALPAVRGAQPERQLERDDDGRIRIGRARLPAARRVTAGIGLGAWEARTGTAAPPCEASTGTATPPCEGSPDEAAATARIEALLLERLARPADASLSRTLAEVARYYARHPEVVQLFDALAPHPWTLEARPGTWLTQARLRGGVVLRVTVLFDFHAAAQMHFAAGCAGQPACTAMPADAFLHELLHVHLIHAAPARFARTATGGFYPHAHEDEVIALENRLYRAMEARDGLPRPARDSHAGRLTAVDCPLCWASREDAGRDAPGAL